MPNVFCTLCGDNVDPSHSGCGRDDCPYRDIDVPSEHVGTEVHDEKVEKPKSRAQKFGEFESWGNEYDLTGEMPKEEKPPFPWKKR